MTIMSSRIATGSKFNKQSAATPIERLGSCFAPVANSSRFLERHCGRDREIRELWLSRFTGKANPVARGPGT